MALDSLKDVFEEQINDLRSAEEQLVEALPKLALNNWLRLAGPAFDASLALEFLDMTGPDVREGVAAVREKRPPRFG